MWFLLLLLLTFSCQQTKAPPKAPSFQQSSILEQKIGKDLLELISHPDQVQSYRVTPNLEKSIERVGPYALLRKGPKVKGPVLDHLKSLIANDQNYIFDKQKKCPFKPEIAFEFIKGEERLLIFISLSCEQMQFFKGNKNTLIDTSVERAKVQQIAQKLFPFDTKFQSNS
ncbi:MAG: hypothetical protein K0S07_1441 [Chlamydiales bacterium]|jgi:hypothetical protein|nr:hypothetical protein [Chlamydiales bacterium]